MIKDDLNDAFRSSCMTYVLFLITLILVYSPIIHNDFLFYDDYDNFTFSQGHQSSLIALGLARPFMGVVVDMLNTSSVLYSGLKRIVGVVGLSWIAMLLYNWFRRHGMQQIYAAILGLTACCLPAFLYTESYLILTMLSYSSFFSGLSAYMFLATFEREGLSIRKKVAAIVMAMLLLFLSLSCYQLNAMFCWAVIAVAIVLTRGSARVKLFRNVAYYAVLFCLTLGIYTVFYRALFYLYPNLQVLSGRSALIGNIPELLAKAKWFLDLVIPVTCSNMSELLNRNLIANPTVIKLVFSLCYLALFIPDVINRKEPIRPVVIFSKGLLIFITIPLCYLPHLVLKENGLNIYYLSTLEVMFYLLFCIGLVNILCLFKRKAGVYVGNLATLLLLFSVCFAANKNLMTKFAMPNALEYRYVKSIVAGSDMSRINKIHIVGHLNFSGVLTYSERLVTVALHDCGYTEKNINITSSSNSIPTILHPEIYNRNSFFEKYYLKNDIWGYYNLRADLSDQETATLLESIKSSAKAYASQKDALVIDLSVLAHMY
jgi:hypothetical protein